MWIDSTRPELAIRQCAYDLEAAARNGPGRVTAVFRAHDALAAADDVAELVRSKHPKGFFVDDEAFGLGLVGLM
jgi:hypothetical protein